MPGVQAGIDGGLTGVISTPGSGVLVQCRVYGWKFLFQGQQKNRSGRGDTDEWQKYRWLSTSGTGAFSGRIQGDKFPLATTFWGLAGTLTFTIDLGKTIAFPILITSVGPERKEPQEDLPNISGTFLITGAATLTGFTGTQPVFSQPSKAVKQVWNGTVFTVDPDDLENGATVTIDVWNTTANTDAAEIALLESTITTAIASPPDSLLKVNPSSFVRDSIDGGTITLNFQLTTTGERIVNANTSTNIDESGLTSSANSAAISPDAPVTPSGDNFVLRDITTRELNDSKDLTVENYGKRTHEQDITFPGSPKSADSSSLEDTEHVTLVQASSTANPPAVPTGLKLIDSIRTQLTDDGEYQWLYLYGRRTREEAIEMDGSPVDTDSSSLVDAYSVTDIRANGTFSAPAATSGFVNLGGRIVQRHAATTGEKWIHQYNYGRVTLLNKIQFEGTYTDGNAGNIGLTAHVRLVNTSATASDPGAPLGVLVYSRSQPMTTSQGSYTGFHQHDFVYGPNTRLNEIINQGQRLQDVASFGNAEIIFDVTDTSTPPGDPTPSNTDLKRTMRTGRRFQVTPEKWEWRFEFRRETREDELEHYHRSVDPDDFGEVEIIPIVHTSRTSSPGTPTQIGTTSNLIRTDVDDLVVANGTFTGLYLWTFHFGPSTTFQLIEQEGRVDREVSELSGVDIQTLVDVNISPLTDPAARITGQQVVRRISIKLQDTPNKWKHVYIFGWLTEEEEIEHRGTSARRQYFRPASGTFFTETLIKTCILTDTVETLLATEIATVEAVTTRPFFAVEVQKINFTHYVVRIDRPNDDKHVTRSGRSSGWERFHTDSSGIFVRVVYAEEKSTNDFRYVLGYYTYWVTRYTYRLRRYYRADNLADVDQNGTEGKRHSDASTFLGRPQYTMAFGGADVVYDWATEGTNRWFAIDFIFEYSSVGHFESEAIPVGVVCFHDSSVTSGSTPTAASLNLANPAANAITNGGNFNTLFLA